MPVFSSRRHIGASVSVGIASLFPDKNHKNILTLLSNTLLLFSDTKGFSSDLLSTMRVTLAILLSTMATSSAFSPVTRSSTANPITGLHMSSPVKVPITITGDNVDLTPALSDYVNLKVDRTLGKLSSVSGVSHCDVYLTVNKNPKVNIFSEC